VPAGLGEPVFDKLHAQLGKAMLSINAVKGFEVGSGFAGAALKGSQQNDRFIKDDKGEIRTGTNHSGGIQGGRAEVAPPGAPAWRRRDHRWTERARRRQAECAHRQETVVAERCARERRVARRNRYANSESAVREWPGAGDTRSRGRGGAVRETR